MHKVLVVEDDDSVWAVLESILESVPCHAERAVDGKTGLDMIRKGGFGTVILDLMLPEMTGEEILAHLNADPKFKGFPILVDSSIAGTNWSKDKIKLFQNLRIETLARPSDPETIVQIMRKLLGLPIGSGSSSARAALKKKVLIVDDESTVRELYVPFFQGKGYETTPAGDGKAALESLKKESVDLMILDLNMPEMSGEEVMAAMADHPKWKSIPIIIDTSLRSNSERVQKIKDDFGKKLRIEFFQRPTNLEDLSEAIQRILII